MDNHESVFDLPMTPSSSFKSPSPDKLRSDSHDPKSFSVEAFFPSPSLTPERKPVGDMSPGKDIYSPIPKSRQSDVRHDENDDQDDASPESSEQPLSQGNILRENPFENEHSKTLFEAIDRLQGLGINDIIDIPQLVIVGGQSSGKSSLLQTLTDIPFPVSSSRCTRFPIRIVSRRTAPGSKNSYHISIERPGARINGLQSAPQEALEYRVSGENLTVEEFQDILDKVAFEEMGIIPGRGPGKVNFVGNVLKVELSGPNRSHFSIIDLPGIYSSDHDTNKDEMIAVKKMVVEYMRMPENIVICVVETRSDISCQEIFVLSINEVPKERLVGVFTKCDVAMNREHIIDLSTGKITADSDLVMHNGWFVVWNRKTGGVTADGHQAEDELFGSHPWNVISDDRRGSKALKTYLANVLSSSIRNAFPNMISSICLQLDACLKERAEMGPMRDTLPAQQQFLTAAVHKFRGQVNLALNRPGYHENDRKELRKTVKDLNQGYDTFMRYFGHCWMFEGSDKDPTEELNGLFGVNAGLGEDDHRVKRTAKGNLEAGGLAHLYGNDTANIKGMLAEEIQAKLPKFQANQLPGVTNPDIYPAMFHEQTKKWSAIAQNHLNKVADSVWICVETILSEVCPPTNDTRILNDGLREILGNMFDGTLNSARQRLREYCEREEKPRLLQTTDPRFADDLEACRQLRFFKAYADFHQIQEGCQDEKIPMKRFQKGFELMHSSTARNMINDVHDILKIYYGLALESFIRHVTSTIIEEFVSHKDGPLEGLTTGMILSLSKEQVESLAMEDEQTVRHRKTLVAKIEKLTVARDVAEAARNRTRQLSAA